MTNTKTNQSSGLRYNNEKLPMHLISPEAMVELAKVLQYGATKYAPNNWAQGLQWNEGVMGSMLRHINAWQSGEDVDPETGLYHASHILANAMFLAHFTATASGTDDRLKHNKKQAFVKENSIEQKARAASRAATFQRVYGSIGSPVEQGYSGFLSEGNQDTVEHGGLLDLQAHVQPSPLQRGSISFGDADGRVEGYSGSGFDSDGFTTQRGLYDCRKEAVKPVPITTQGQCCGEIPLANGNRYSGPTGPFITTELCVHDNLGAYKTFYLGDGCLNVGIGSGSKPTT